jgi:hypothetical protein
MITGHFGLAAGAKSVDVRAPLWSLMLATVWLDVLFTPLLLLNIETIVTLPGGGYGNRVINADYTHSLLGALVLCAAFGAVAWWRWDHRLGLLLGCVAFSHWVLDLMLHREDMPILPGNAGDLPLLGFGLWRVPIVAIPLRQSCCGEFRYRVAKSVAAGVTGARGGALLASGGIVLLLDGLASSWRPRRTALRDGAARSHVRKVSVVAGSMKS